MNHPQLTRRFAALAATIATLGTLALSTAPANASPMRFLPTPGASTSSPLVHTGHLANPRMRG